MGEVMGPLDGGGFFSPKNHRDHLIAVTRIHRSEMRYDDMRKQDSEVLTVDLACFSCDGPQAQLQEGILLGSPYIVSKIRRDGNVTCGYVRELPPKPGMKDGAQVLEAPLETDIPHISAWWQAVQQEQIKPPVASAPAQQASPWGGQQQQGPPPPQQSSPQQGWGQPQPQPSPPPESVWAGTNAAPAQPAPAAPAAAPPANGAPAPNGSGVTPDMLRGMLPAAVQAMVAQGVIPAEMARAAGHQV